MKCLYCLSSDNEAKAIHKDIQNSHQKRGAEILKLVDRLQVRIGGTEEESGSEDEKENEKKNIGKNYLSKIQTRLFRFALNL